MPSSTRLFQQKHKALIKRLEEVLAKKEWTQRDLANATGLKDSAISRIMHGNANLTLKTISLLEDRLGEQLINVSEV